MIETIKQSQAQNPDPQGHSGALGKRNRPTKYHRAFIPYSFCLCENSGITVIIQAKTYPHIKTGNNSIPPRKT